MGAAVPFLVTLMLLPLMGVISMRLVSLMLMRDVEWYHGVLGLLAAWGAFAFGLWMNKLAIMLVVGVLYVALMAFWPFASRQMNRAEFFHMDVEALDKAFRTIAQRPDSVPSYFEISRRLYDLGYVGPAIAIGERTLAGISTANDPLRNASMRDFYKDEEQKIKRWRRDLQNPRAFDPVECPVCHTRNDPSAIMCSRCSRPHLLEIVRANNQRGKTLGKLVLAFGTITLLVPVGVFFFMFMPASVGLPVFIVTMSLSGLVLWSLFRGQTGGFDSVGS